MAKTFNQFKKKIDELYWPKAGDEAKFMAMHGPYTHADVGGPETHNDAIFNGTIVQKDHTKLAPPSEDLPDGQSELKDLIKNIHSRETDELLKTVAHLNLSTDPKHREHRDVINKELMYRYKNHSMSEELIGGQKNLDVHPHGRPDGRLTAKDFAILRARKNKKKMNEELGFKPVKVSVGPYVGNERDQGGGHHVIAHGPNGEKKNVTQWATDQTEAGRIAASTAKEHGLKPDRNKPFGHFIEESELAEAFDVYLHDEKGGKEGRRVSHSKFFQTKEIIDHLKNGHKVTVTHTRGDHVNKAVLHPGDHVKDKTKGLDIHPGVTYHGPDGPYSGIEEGKFGNAMAKFTGKSKAPFVSRVIQGIQTGQAARAAKKSKADPDNFDKLMNYANARNKVREETKIDESSHAEVNKLRAAGEYRKAGELAAKSGHLRSYGAHEGMRSTRQASQAEFLKGYDSVKEEVEEGYVSVNGQRVGPRRQPMSFAQRVAARGGERTPEQKAKTEKALKDIEDKMSAKFTPDYMKKAADNAAAERKRQVDAEKAKRGISESSHKIARAIMMNEKVNLNTEEIELEDGNVIEIDIELAEAIADLFDSLDEDDQDALAEMLHSDIESFMEVVDLLENDGE
jgi:hypothetical protein